MLTIFAIPKPFKAHIATIQRNAITSWSWLRPRPEIILFGDEQGTAETAAGLGLHHVPRVARNEYGTPLLNDIFEKAQDLASHDMVCYVNADIILTSDFMRAAQQVASWRAAFLMVGGRWNFDLAEGIEFESPDWEVELRAAVLQRGSGADWVDYFLFSRGLFRNLPPFAVGRLWWDCWLIWKALSQSIPVVDASRDVIAIHQNHPYGFPGGLAGVFNSKEGKRNEELAGGIHRQRGIEEATHRLVTHETTVVERRAPVDMLLASLRGACLRWSYRVGYWAWFGILTITRPLRHYLGLRQENLSVALRALGKVVKQ